MPLLDYWPTLENVLACVRSEAEHLHEEVVLAVHQPVSLERHFIGGRTESCGQQQLLEYFLTPTPEGRRLLAPIIGSSGIGKSHLIRWLDVQVRRAEGAERRHIVRIPKGTSLGGVLRLVLDERLHGPVYDELNEELKTAREPLDELDAGELLRAQLLIALQRIPPEAKAAIAESRRQGKTEEPRDLVRARLPDSIVAVLQSRETQSHFLDREAKPIPVLDYDLRLMFDLEDVSRIPTEDKNRVVVADVNKRLHFRIFDTSGKTVVDTDENQLPTQADPINKLREKLEKLRPPHELDGSDKAEVVTAVTSIVGRTPVLSALARRVAKGLSRDEEDQEQGLFKPSDFVWDTPPAGTAIATRNAVITLSKTPDPGKESNAKHAADLMNGLIDRAVNSLIDANGTQLTELFSRLRKAMLADKLELVLLVEDFANLAGIQQSLLQAFIEDADYDGVEKLCTIRVALAVTPGYLNTFRTFGTRADSEWHMTEARNTDEDEVVSRAVEMIGGYLNAARIGAAGLRASLDAQPVAERGSWSPVFTPLGELAAGDEDALTAFGQSAAGRPLFPFNRAAVAGLVHRHLTEGGQLVFNPRFLINRFLLPILRDQREAFVRREFPPIGFEGHKDANLSGDLINSLIARVGNLGRYPVVLYYWGGNPRTLDAVDLPAAVYRAFGLEPLPQGQTQPTVKRTEEKKVAKGPPPPPPGELEKWYAVLDAWRRQKRQLSQRDRLDLRTILLRVVNDGVDWDHAQLPHQNLARTENLDAVFVPRSAGEQRYTPETALFALCDETTLDDPERGSRLERELKAVLRSHFLEGFDREGGEEDYALVAEFVRPRAAQAAAFCRRRVLGKDDALGPLTQALLLSARLLDVDGAHANDHAEWLKAIFTEVVVPAELPPGKPESRWRQLLRALSSERSGACKLLLALVGARQGGADTIHGIDAAPLLDEFQTLARRWQITAGLPEPPATASDEARQAHKLVDRLQPGRLNPVLAQRRLVLTQWRQDTLAWLGDPFDKQAIVKQVGEIVAGAHLAGVYKGLVERDVLRALLREFEKAPVKEALDQVGKFTDDLPNAQVLTILGRVKDDVREAADGFRVAGSGFVEQTTKTIDAKLRELGGEGDPVADEVKKIQAALDGIESALKSTTVGVTV